jgi:hypothetical protein
MERTTNIVIEAKSKFGDVELMGFRAIINYDDPSDMKLYDWAIDKDACKEHRSIVRQDQAAFEDYAYEMQDKLIAEK